MDYQKINSKTIDRWVKEGWKWGIPVSHDEYLRALKGDYVLFLTPTKPVPEHWLKDIKGKKVLGLASGGAQQMPILTALGARCTILDFSDSQLESERKTAEREGYEIKIIKADMSKPLPFEDESFDFIIHPVSNCYVEDVESIWKECYRVLKHGGYLLSGMDHYLNYLVDEDEKMIINEMPFNPLKNPEQMKQMIESDCGVQFSHSLEEQIGGQLKAGFRLLELYEDYNGEGRLNDMHIPTMLATRSVKE